MWNLNGNTWFFDQQICEFPLDHEGEKLMKEPRRMASLYIYISYLKTLNTHHNYFHVPCGDVEILVSL